MRVWVWVALAAFCTTGHAATLHIDTFDTTTQGWAGGSSPTRVSGGGPGGASDPFLRINSVGNNLATFNLGSPWVGDLAAIAANQVNVDLMAPTTSAPLSIRLVLFGPTSTDDRWTSALAESIPNDGVWRSYTFALSDLVKVQGVGAYAELMANTLRVMLRHDIEGPSTEGSPVIGSLGIDNIELAAVPEPAGMAIVGALLAAGTPLWRQRSRFAADAS